MRKSVKAIDLFRSCQECLRPTFRFQFLWDWKCLTFYFSTLYTSISHDLLKSRISNLVHNAFRKKHGSVRKTHIIVTRSKGYFTHDINGGGDNMHTADNICKMIEFLIDNIFVQFGGHLVRQVIGIPVGWNCAPLLADLFLYSYENEFSDNMIRSGHRRLASHLIYAIDTLMIWLFLITRSFLSSQRDISIPADC